MLKEKKENKSPAFQFYARDFLTDINVQLMSMEERGIYITLLAFAWLENGVPNDISVLSRLCGNPPKFEESMISVMNCFYELDGRLYNKRMESIRLEQKEKRVKASEAGKKGAKIRWQSDGKAIATPMPSHNSATATATSTTTASTTTKIPYDKVVAEYNGILSDSLHRVQKLNSSRRSLIKRMWKDNPKLEYFIAYYKKVKQTPFLLGDNNNGWTADFDFLHKEKTVIKIEEGAYKRKEKDTSTYFKPKEYTFTCSEHRDIKRKGERNLYVSCPKCGQRLVDEDKLVMDDLTKKVM